jgi:ISXO2-like transposase domain/Transposase
MGRERYTQEFKREAVRQASQPGASTARVAQELGLHANLLHRWVRELVPSKVGIFAAKSISPSAIVVSDGLWCFRGVRLIGAEHEAIVTGGGKTSARRPEFKAVNTVLSNLKTALSGTYHSFKFAKYAHRYLAEVQYRFNRRYDLAVIFSRLLRAAALTPPQPRRLLLAAEVRR